MNSAQGAEHISHVDNRAAKTLAETLERGNNNFDLIRLLAALAVMFGHSFGISGGHNFEWMLQFTHRESFGSLAVYAFFLVSGLLVSASYVKQAAPLRFVALRALRIWPAAVVCALFIGLIVGPVFTVTTPAAYFSNDYTQQWLLHNMTLLGRVGGLLPGVFVHNHLGSLVNATAWTLPVELQCYVIVLVLGLLGLLTSRVGMVMAISLLGIAFAYVVSHPAAHITLGNFFTLSPAYSFYPVPYFFLGMLLFTFRDRVKLHWAPAVLGAIAYVAFRYNAYGQFLLYPVFAYGVLWVASIRPLSAFQPRHDYSYGIYLYGFVVQQGLTAIFPSWSNYLNFLIAVPVTVLLAAMSWHLVERPCLDALRKTQDPFPVRAGAVAGSGA